MSQLYSITKDLTPLSSLLFIVMSEFWEKNVPYTMLSIAIFFNFLF